MQKSKLSVRAGLFSAAIFALATLTANAAPAINGTYAAVTPQSVELLTLRAGKHDEVGGTYRVLHLDATQPDGVADQRVALSSLSSQSVRAFTLSDARSMILRFDAKFQRAEATTPALSGNATQSFKRVTPEQVGLLMEMARYGGLYEVCKAHRDQAASLYSHAFCAGMSAQLSDIVPFRPFPQASANRPVLAYQMHARLDRTLVFNR